MRFLLYASNTQIYAARLFAQGGRTIYSPVVHKLRAFICLLVGKRTVTSVSSLRLFMSTTMNQFSLKKHKSESMCLYPITRLRIFYGIERI